MMLKQSSKPSTKNYKDSPSHSRGDVQFPSISTAPQTESREDDASVSFPLLPSREFLTFQNRRGPSGFADSVVCAVPFLSTPVRSRLSSKPSPSCTIPARSVFCASL